CCRTSSAVFRNSGFGATGAWEETEFNGSAADGDADWRAAAVIPTARTNSKPIHRFIPASRKYGRARRIAGLDSLSATGVRAVRSGKPDAAAGGGRDIVTRSRASDLTRGSLLYTVHVQ